MIILIIKNGTKINGITVDSSSILAKGRVFANNPMTPTSETIHNTSNPNVGAENHRKFLINHNKYSATGVVSSWHFTVDDIKIVQHLDTHKQAYHAGTTLGNQTSIAIEVCEFTDAKKQAKAYENAKALARYLQVNVATIKTVRSHKSWSGKNCPRKILALSGGIEGFVASMPKDITINGVSTAKPVVKPPVKPTAPAKPTTIPRTFKETDTHIGVVEVLATKLNVRQKADFDSKIVEVADKTDRYRVIAIENGLYKVGTGKYLSMGTKYVRYYDNPYLDDKGKKIVTTKKLKVLVDSLYTYKTADWNNKGITVNKNEVYTVVGELTISGSKMYKLKSGLYITANPKYVQIIK